MLLDVSAAKIPCEVPCEVAKTPCGAAKFYLLATPQFRGGIKYFSGLSGILRHAFAIFPCSQGICRGA
jgi:hypothetical protein